MTEELTTPKRRGRPPGSKNKPKDPSTPKLVSLKQPTVEAPAPTAFMDFPPNATPDQVAHIQASVLSTTVAVVLQFGAALGKETEDHEVQWPADWPIPNVNDAVMAGPKLGGRVISRNFRFHEGKIYLLLN